MKHGNYEGIMHVLNGVSLDLGESRPEAPYTNSCAAYEPLPDALKVEWLEASAFVMESIAHLRGLERELLPHADALRYMAKEWK
jgi:hypothetical protein